MRGASALIFGGLLLAAPVCAAQTIPWKDVNGWSVLIDPSTGNDCFISTMYEDGTILRLGFNFFQSQSQIYLALGNSDWKSLEVGKDYPVQIQFDRNPVWNATVQGIDFGGINFLSVSTTDTNFAEEFSRKLGMRATFNGREVAAFGLKGSARAVTEMINCQESVNAAASARSTPQSPKDPFEAVPDKKNANDPFEL
ncbi:hypothetical protein GOD82_17635 [Sinorhizobium medicae]|nr:hypothetical protein [Sinorhizobium medicae]